MPGKRRNYSPEFKEEAARLVVDSARPIAYVAREIGVHDVTLGCWVTAYWEKHVEEEPPLGMPGRARLRELERENRELKMKCEFLTKGAAYFEAEHR